MLEGTELDGLPLYLEKQKAVLVGRVSATVESPLADMAAYYMHARGSVVVGEQAGERLVPEQLIDCDNHLMSENAKAFEALTVPVELSSVGEALLDAAALAESDILGDKQAHVYSLRDIHGFTRGETATVLDVEPSTVDSHRYSALDTIEGAEQLVKTRDELLSHC